MMVKKTFTVSRRMFWSFMALFFLTGLISVAIEPYDIRPLETVVGFLSAISIIMLLISLIMPGILILLGSPWLARAWHRGINPIAVSDTPWELLTSGQKFLTYLWSILVSGFAVLATIELIAQYTVR